MSPSTANDKAVGASGWKWLPRLSNHSRCHSSLRGRGRVRLANGYRAIYPLAMPQLQKQQGP